MLPPILTSGAVGMICAGEAALKPLLQVVDIRLVNTAQDTKERYRMVLSDGLHLQQSMLATAVQIRNRILTNILHKNNKHNNS